MIFGILCGRRPSSRGVDGGAITGPGELDDDDDVLLSLTCTGIYTALSLTYTGVYTGQFNLYRSDHTY